MNWKFLLATLNSQGNHLSCEDFKSLSQYEYLLNYPEKLIFEIQPGALKNFLIENPKWYETAKRAYSWCERTQTQFVLWGESGYPKKLYEIKRPPLILFFKGSPCWEETSMLSVVGSRYPSVKSLEWMEAHLSPIVKYGVCLVSGAARGVDQKAHAISIRNNKPTIAFMPSGLNRLYPKEFKDWAVKIMDSGGALVSEYLPDQEMRKHHFLERNRMIAALGKCLLVVEAKLKSGSIMTGRLAVENNQTVCVLPAFPSDTNFSGSLELLFNGAQPIRDNLDLKILMDSTVL